MGVKNASSLGGMRIEGLGECSPRGALGVPGRGRSSWLVQGLVAVGVGRAAEWAAEWAFVVVAAWGLHGTRVFLPPSLPAGRCQGWKLVHAGGVIIWPVTMHLLAESLHSSGLSFFICKLGEHPDKLEPEGLSAATRPRCPSPGWRNHVCFQPLPAPLTPSPGATYPSF